MSDNQFAFLLAVVGIAGTAGAPLLGQRVGRRQRRSDWLTERRYELYVQLAEEAVKNREYVTDSGRPSFNRHEEPEYDEFDATSRGIKRASEVELVEWQGRVEMLADEGVRAAFKQYVNARRAFEWEMNINDEIDRSDWDKLEQGSVVVLEALAR